MRGFLLVAALMLAVPLSGCIGGPGAVAVGVFSAWDLPEGSPAPVPVADCGDLLNVLTDRAWRETETLLEQSLERGHGRYVLRADVAFDSASVATAELKSAGADAAEGGSARDADVTGTNNQEAGVDEGDILKTDGEWTYVLRSDGVYILRSHDVGDIARHHKIVFEERQWGGALLLEPRDPADPSDDRLVVITHRAPQDDRVDTRSRDAASSYLMPNHATYTNIAIYELNDRSDPLLLKELWVEGNNAGARLIDGHAYIVVHAHGAGPDLRTETYVRSEDLERRGLEWEDYHAMSAAQQKQMLRDSYDEARAENWRNLEDASVQDHLPQILRAGLGGTVRPVPVDEERCGRTYVTENATGRSVTTIVAIDTDSTHTTDRTTQIIGSTPIVYAATDALVLATPSRDSWWFWHNRAIDDSTDLQWFDLDGLDVTHRASGRVAGKILDSFALDVHDDTLRVATTTGQWGRWWMEDPEPMLNHVVVFREVAGELVPQGMVGGIAPEERLWSVRFTDDRAYLITFEQIDPLWVIDLQDATEPKILGELEIPGVSTYIHPLSEDLLLTIGMGPGENGRGLDRSRLQVSLFDIRDPTNPTRADVLDVTPKNGWSWSGALHEHKAFTYWDRLGLLAIPVSTHVYDRYGGDESARNHIGLRLIDVDMAAQTLSVRGSVDQDLLVPTDGRSYYGANIERSYFLGFPDEGEVSVYALSRFGVTAHDLADLGLQDQAAFDLEESHGYYY